jgi:muconate cycloisomerase
VTVEQDGILGVGEFSPVSLAGETAETAHTELSGLAEELVPLSPFDYQATERLMDEHAVRGAARCALDTALWDWVGKRCGVPVWQLVGTDTSRLPITTLTVGINPVDIVRERTVEYVAFGARALKIKLGSPQGTDHDKAIYATVRENAPTHLPLRVDANGGWQSVEEATQMIRWLAERGCEYVEQPLAKGREAEMPALFATRSLPLYADESCFVASDVPKLVGCVDGINLKLMKAGGITPGLRVIHAARAHGLGMMIGCMGEASVAISAGVALSSFCDYVDLDSHLNLNPDPYVGLGWHEGRVLPSDAPGLGVTER